MVSRQETIDVKSYVFIPSRQYERSLDVEGGSRMKHCYVVISRAKCSWSRMVLTISTAKLAAPVELRGMFDRESGPKM